MTTRIGAGAFIGYITTIFAANWLIQHVGLITLWPTDYEACIELYRQAEVDLWAEPLVGLGTVCRRSRSTEVAAIVNQLGGLGLSLHGFGMKSRGVARVAHSLTSADSMAWSTRGRYEWQHERRRLCGGVHVGGCANCLPWALIWRQRVVDGLGLFGTEGEA